MRDAMQRAPSNVSTPPTPALRELVRRHAVRYEVRPHVEIVRAEKLTTKFDVELQGAHARDRTRLSPGCPRCVETYRALRELATWATSIDHDLSSVEIEPFDDALHIVPLRGPMVVLTIRIRARSGTARAVEESERRCLHEVRRHLDSLTDAAVTETRLD